MTLFKITSLAIPNLMAMIAPFSFLIACLHTLNRLNGDSELIVLTAAGSKVWTVARPLLLLAALISIGLALVAHLAQPWSMRLLKDFIVQVRTDLLTQVIQPGRFSSPEPNLTFHIRERALNGELLGLVMHDTRDPKQAQSYLAERGVIVKQDPTAYLVMTNGHILRRSDADDPAQIIAFDKYAVDLDKFEPEGSDDNELKPRERYFSELAYPDPKSGLYQNQPGLFRSELHERLSSPFYPFAFVFIVIAFCGQARSTRTSRMQNLVLAFVTAAGCRLAGLGLNNLVAAKASMVPTLYLLPLCAVLVSLIAIKSGGRQSSGPSRLGEIKDVIAMALAKITARSPLKRAGQRS